MFFAEDAKATQRPSEEISASLFRSPAAMRRTSLDRRSQMNTSGRSLVSWETRSGATEVKVTNRPSPEMLVEKLPRLFDVTANVDPAARSQMSTSPVDCLLFH